MRKIKIDLADKYFSLYIRNRDSWQCKNCGRHYEPPTSNLHCSHFVGRGKESTRFDPLNADAMCFHCHQYFTSHPIEHYDWQIKHKGEILVNKLRLAGNSYKKKDRVIEKIYWQKKLFTDFQITV